MKLSVFIIEILIRPLWNKSPLISCQREDCEELKIKQENIEESDNINIED